MRPIRGKNFDEKVTRAAWQTKPSWYIVASNDHMIDPGQQRAMAAKIKATTSEFPTSHVPMVSRPKEVVEVIAAAVERVAN